MAIDRKGRKFQQKLARTGRPQPLDPLAMRQHLASRPHDAKLGAVAVQLLDQSLRFRRHPSPKQVATYSHFGWIGKFAQLDIPADNAMTRTILDR